MQRLVALELTFEELCLRNFGLAIVTSSLSALSLSTRIGLAANVIGCFKLIPPPLLSPPPPGNAYVTACIPPA